MIGRRTLYNVWEDVEEGVTETHPTEEGPKGTPILKREVFGGTSTAPKEDSRSGRCSRKNVKKVSRLEDNRIGSC